MQQETPHVEETSVKISTGPCPSCGSRDNLATYSDGHTYCFGGTCSYRTNPDESRAMEVPAWKTKPSDLVDQESIAIVAIKARGISLDTCKHFSYGVTQEGGEYKHVAQYKWADGSAGYAAQHMRTQSKGFPWKGNKKEAQPFFGQHLCRTDGLRVVITEGELDCMSVSQAQQLKWPVVSIKSGAGNAAQDVAQGISWLLEFPEVVVMFDNDDAGTRAAEVVAAMLPPGRCKIATLPEKYKDANDAIMAGDTKAIIEAIWGAKLWAPAGIVSIADVRAELDLPPEHGLSYPWDSINRPTFGRQWGTLVGIGAGTGVGKTDFIAQMMAHDVIELKQDIFVIAFEAHYTETATVLAGKIGGRKFHLPATVDNQWTAEEKNAALDAMESKENGTVHLYDARGEADWDTVEKRIEFMHANHGVKVFYIDNLTAFAAANPEKERTIIEGIMGKMAALTTRLGIIAHYVSHLATPEGKSHEEGGSVLVRHFKGARAIGFWTHTVIGLERNTIDEDEDSKRTVCVVLLKIRKNGSKAGTRVMLKMNKQNNLEESKHDFIRRPPQAAAAADSPF